MYVTIVSGRVARQNWIPLASTFDRMLAKYPPAGLLKSCLVQSDDDPARWRIVSMWSDKSDFEQYADSKKPDAYIELMCDAGTTPDRHGYEMKVWYERV